MASDESSDHPRLPAEVVERVEDLLTQASRLGLHEPAAMTLATVSPEGRPSARVVLLRQFDDRGFVFYTNLESDKGRDLAAHPLGALCFFWDILAQQIRAEGEVIPVSTEQADAYWVRRPRASQISAWASAQSRRLDARQTLEARVAEMEKRFAGQQIPRPPFWSGYRLVPRRVEFWMNRPARLHERVVYQWTDSGWTSGLLYP